MFLSQTNPVCISNLHFYKFRYEECRETYFEEGWKRDAANHPWVQPIFAYWLYKARKST